MIEGYYEFAICSTLNFYYLSIGMSGELAASTISIFIAVVITLTIPFSLGILLKNKNALETDDIEIKYSSLYEGLKIDKMACYTVSILGMIRRLLLVAIYVFMRKYPTFQILCCIYL
jgi:hypothetical protein